MIIGLIPSRLNSKRLKKKPLLKIDGLPIIVHTYKRSKLSKKLDDVIVCTDHKKILYAISSSLGKHDNDKVLFFVNKMKMPLINLDNFTSFDTDLLGNQIDESIKLYDQFIMDNLIFQENVFSYNQIKEVLYK